MSRSESSREVSVTASSPSTSSGRSPVRSTSVAAVRRDQLAVGRDAHAATSAGTSPSSSSCATTSRGALLGLVLPRCRPRSPGDGLLVRVVDAGEALDLAGERLRVEALHVAARALVDRGLDVAPRRTAPHSSTIARALLPRLLVRRDRRGDDRGAVPRRAARRPSRSARCSCRGPPSRTRGPSRGACGRCRRRGTRRRAPRRSSSGPTRCAIVVFPEPERPGEPEREAAVAAVLGLGVLVRVDVARVMRRP